MRHGKKINHLGRTNSHRKAMLSNMASSLITHKRIFTTLAKAKALRVYVEPLITKSKVDSTHSRRVVFSNLQDKNAVTELFREVSPKIINRNGGYTRIIKTGKRLGDNSEMCMIELVDFNEIYNNESTTKKTASKRTRRSGAKKTEDAVVETVSDDVVADAVEVKTTDEVAPEEATPKAEKEEKPAKEEGSDETPTEEK